MSERAICPRGRFVLEGELSCNLSFDMHIVGVEALSKNPCDRLKVFNLDLVSNSNGFFNLTQAIAPNPISTNSNRFYQKN